MRRPVLVAEPEIESSEVQPRVAGPSRVDRLLDQAGRADKSLQSLLAQLSRAERRDYGQPWDDLLGLVYRQSLGYFASEVLRGDPAPPYDGRFLLGRHHIEWDELVALYKRLCILAPRDHGKCAVWGSLILRTDGQRIPIQEWRGGHVFALAKDGRSLAHAWAPESSYNGIKRCLRVRTRTGRTETVTYEHPFRTFDRWVRAEDLRPGMRIAVVRELRVFGDREFDSPWLAGLLVGDGGLTGSRVSVTVADAPLLARVRRVVRARGWTLSPSADPITYGLKSLSGRRETTPGRWARKLGLAGHTSWTKRVPAALFSSRSQDVTEFLAGYFQADGSVNLCGGGALSFYSVNRDLLADVQHLLMRLGIISVLGPKNGRYRGKPHLSWQLTVRGKSILGFARQLGRHLVGDKRQRVRRLAKAQEKKREGGTVDLLPTEAYQLLIHTEHWFRKCGYPRYSKRCGLTRDKARALARAEQNMPLWEHAESPILWDEVASVEDAGKHRTWGLSVPGMENYVGQDVVNHNTYFFDFAYPIWMGAFNPDRATYIFSASQDQAVRILEDIKLEIEENERLQWLYPNTPSKNWSGRRIRLSNRHQIYARGYGTRSRGAHPLAIVVDDGLDDNTAYSETVRRKVEDYFFNAISPMCVPGGQIVVVGTPFHEVDLYARLSKNPEYHFARYQAWDDRTDSALWPERYDRDRLWHKRREIGSVRFAREYQCVPVSDEMSLFPSHLFIGDPVEQPTVVLGQPIHYWRERGITSVYIGVDFAISSSAGADYTVIWVVGLDAQRNRWILDVHREKGMPFRKQKSLLTRYGVLYQPDLMVLESNQMQRIFGDELKVETDLPIMDHNTGVEKHGLEKGIPGMRIFLENKKYRIPRGDQNSIDKTDVWVSEMRGWTFEQGKVVSVAEHDDTAMASWLAEIGIAQGAFDFSFGEDFDPAKPYDPMEELEAEERAAHKVYIESVREALGEDAARELETEDEHEGNLVDDVDDPGLDIFDY